MPEFSPLADLADLHGCARADKQRRRRCGHSTPLRPFEGHLYMYRARSPPQIFCFLLTFCSMLRTTLVGSRVHRAQLEHTATGAATICCHYANRARRLCRPPRVAPQLSPAPAMRDTQVLMATSAAHVLQAHTRPSEGAAHACAARSGNSAAVSLRGIRLSASPVWPASIQIRWARPRKLRALHARRRSTLRFGALRPLIIVSHVPPGSIQSL